MLWIQLILAPIQWLRVSIFWMARPRLLVMHYANLTALYRSRQALAELDDRLLADIGVSKDMAAQEVTSLEVDEVACWASEELQATMRESREIANGAPVFKRSFYQTRGRGDLYR